MGKFNKNFEEYAKDNFISAEEIQELAKAYSSQVLSGQPDASDNYNKEWKLTKEKEFWKKFKKRYKKSGGETLGVAGVAGRLDKEKLLAAYNNPKYGPPVKEEEKKEKEEEFKGRDYNLDFKNQTWNMEEHDVSDIDAKYNIDKLEGQVDRIEARAKEPGSFKSYINKLRGEVSKPDKIMVNKSLTRDIKKNKKQIKKLSKFNPDPIKMTSFRDASIKGNKKKLKR